MSIKRIEIKDFLVFRGEFELEFSTGVNVFIGENGTGKTTLLRCLYDNGFVTIGGISLGGPFSHAGSNIYDSHSLSPAANSYPQRNEQGVHKQQGRDVVVTVESKISGYVYIPEKDMLSHSKGLPETVRHGNAQFTQYEIDIIEMARVLPNTPEQPLYRKICDIIGGEPEHDGQNFFMKRKDIINPVPFSLEASGYRKFGLLALLIRNEQIRPGSVLFWDEPENSLNPELYPVLSDILLELSRSGVQIFAATHSELLAKYISIRRTKDDEVIFYSLYKENKQIRASENDRFSWLHPNRLTEVPVELYKERIDKAFGDI